MHTKSRSIAVRAILAVMLTIGFYALALVVVCALLAIIYLQREGAVVVPLFALTGSAAIIWSIMPRFERFKSPGVRLMPDKQPRFFEQIRRIAEKTNQRMPSEVYLVLEPLACVEERVGIMGIGARRVIEIGLPLLQALNVSEVRCVMAHEFGHYYAGDTKLSPWVYGTYETIARTFGNLHEESRFLRVTELLFRLYGYMFLRLTLAVAREQEFAADRLSAQVGGAQAAIQALRNTCAVSSIFNTFWQTEIVPVLTCGYYVPISEGFGEYLRVNPIVDAMDQVKREEADSETGIYDTHPALRERVAAFQALSAGHGVVDENPALSWIQNLPEVETALLTFLQRKLTRELKPLEWQEVGMQVYPPLYRENLKGYRYALGEVTWALLPEFLHAPHPLAEDIQGNLGQQMTQTAIDGQVVGVVGQSLALELVRRGWTLEKDLGKAPRLRCNSEILEPFSLVGDLQAGKISADEWLEHCKRLGILQSTLAGER